jgi:LysR family transcriptional activator of nhaA
MLVEHCRIPDVTESFYAIVQTRRFPNQLLAEVLSGTARTASSEGS